ncbi:MAG: EamA family transporter, partial [Pseudomonadales bacterium]
MQPNTLALVSLFGAGLLLAVTTNLGKVASTLGVYPLAYLTWSLVGACVILLPLALWRGRTPRTDRRSLEYYFLAALLTVAGSNLIFFSVVGRLGVSFVALMYALPPLLTYAGEI